MVSVNHQACTGEQANKQAKVGNDLAPVTWKAFKEGFMHPAHLLLPLEIRNTRSSVPARPIFLLSFSTRCRNNSPEVSPPMLAAQSRGPAHCSRDLGTTTKELTSLPFLFSTAL